MRKMLISLLFLDKNICCGYSLEAPWWGASNEYPQHMFLSRNKKNIMRIPVPHLICSYVYAPAVQNPVWLLSCMYSADTLATLLG